MWEDVQFEYTGKTALTVNGSIPGKRYRFEHTGSTLVIDYRDAAGMMGIPVLRKVKQLFYFKALETGDVSKVAPIDKLSVAIAIGLAFLILKEPVDIKTITGAGLIVAGTLVLIW